MDGNGMEEHAVDEKAASEATAPVSKRRLVIGLASGAAVLLLLAVLFVVFVVIPALRPAVPTDSTNVTDIAREPNTTWSYDWAGDGEFLNDTPAIVSVGAQQALVWGQFDYSAFLESQGDDAGWYVGYDAAYNAGFDSGTEYAKAVAAYNDDTYPYSVVAPDVDDYMQPSSEDGYRDGFADAAAGAKRGTSQKQRPDPPEFTPMIALVDAADGTATWSVDLSKVIDGIDVESTYTAYDVPGSTAVAVAAAIPKDGTSRYVLLALDRSTGEVLSELDADGPIDVTTLHGDIVAAVSDVNGTETTVSRYSVGSLDAKPKWKARVNGAAFVYVAGSAVVAFTENGGEVLDGDSGKEAAWGEDVDFQTSYREAGGALLRVVGSGDGEAYDIQGWGTDGKPTWDAPIHTDFYEIRDGALFTAETKGATFAQLVRIDPDTGKPMWSAAYKQAFDGILGIEGGRLLVASGTKVILVDAASGAVLFSQKVGEFYNMYFGTGLYYVPSDDALTAYHYDKLGPAWSFDLDEGETISTIGTRLVLVDADSGTIRGLAP